MKYGKIFLILALAALLGACGKEMSEREKLDNRVKDAQKLEVKYSRGGIEVQTLTFNHKAVKATVDVEINSPDLKWKLESVKNWCTVEAGEHRGSGSVVLYVTANDGFDAREPATLTFVAGQYRGAEIQVNQSASAFVISQPYFICTKDGGVFNFNVTTEEGVDWTIEDAEWITSTPGAPVTAAGFTTTPVQISVPANEGAAQFGSVTLTAGDEQDEVYVYQFGDNVTYNDAGEIFFGQDAASFSIVAPAAVVREFKNLPEFATGTIVTQQDGTDLITITLEQNISDINETREVPISLSLNSTTPTVVALPTMIQDYTPSHGLLSQKGLKALAAAIAEGGSTESWEREGVITLLDDINMAGVTDWAGIGSAEKPFSAKIDGANHSIKNLRSSKPVFNVCKDAEISNLALDPLCEFSFTSGSALGALVSSAQGTSISNCSFAGKMAVTAASAGAMIGGIVGQVDTASVIQKCVVSAEITITLPSLASAFIGGVAGYSEGSISESELTGTLNITASPTTLRAGGITSVLGEHTSVFKNSFSGDIILSGTSGTNIRLGGLYGSLEDGDRVFDSAAEDARIAGSISINGFAENAASLVYAGGLLGYVDSGIALTVKGYTCSTNISLDHSTNNHQGKWLCYGGILGGCDDTDPTGTLLFENVTTQGIISNKYDTGKYVKVTRICIGGIAGHVNGPTTFKSCKNLGEVGAQTGADYPANSNGNSQVIGGIAGLCNGGDMLFDDCENTGNVSNLHYDNNPILFVYKTSTSKYNYFDPDADANAMYTAMSTGGIIGAYNYWAKLENNHLTVRNCRCSCKLNAYRGSLGGIAGFAGNAEFNACTWTGTSIHSKVDKTTGLPTDNLASDKGGMVGTAARASFSGCVAKGNMETHRYGSAETANAGGIVAYAAGWEAKDSVIVDGCSFSGELINGANKNGAQPAYLGGLLGRNDVVGTAVRTSKFGGKVCEQEITTQNLSDYVVSHKDGNPNATILGKVKPVIVSDNSYWNGN